MALTAAVSRAAHALGCEVEAELGHVGSGSNLDDFATGGKFTDPDEAVKFIELGILTRLSDGKLGDIDRVHVLRPAVGGIQSKAARMREAIKNASSRRELRDGTLTLHFSQQMVYPMFNKPEIAEKFRLAVQKLTGQNVRVVMQPMDTVTQINQRKIEELAHFPNVTIR